MLLCRFKGAKIQKKSFSRGGFSKKSTIIPTRQGRHPAVRVVFGECQGHQEDLRGVLGENYIAINLCEGADYDRFRAGINL